jgi:SAM-dependent methyltransferase
MSFAEYSYCEKRAVVSQIRLFSSESEQTALIRGFIAQQVQIGRRVEILEAGCGSSWLIDLGGINYSLTGVDLDAVALSKRVNVTKDLDEGIHADLRKVDLGDRQFDVVYNSFVLEHISGAEIVLDRLVSWLRPSGVLIILIPDPGSAYGFVTKMTPHWFHVFFYRFLLGKVDAGKPGHAPYRTFYDPVVSRGGILDYCAEHGLTVEAEFGDGYWKPGTGFAKIIVGFSKWAIKILSGGRLSDRHTYLLYVIRRGSLER